MRLTRRQQLQTDIKADKQHTAVNKCRFKNNEEFRISFILLFLSFLRLSLDQAVLGGGGKLEYPEKNTA